MKDTIIIIQKGIQGRIGNQGLSGAQGMSGVQGFQGLPGANGATGATGSTGGQGQTGPQGLVGNFAVNGYAHIFYKQGSQTVLPNGNVQFSTLSTIQNATFLGNNTIRVDINGTYLIQGFIEATTGGTVRVVVPGIANPPVFNVASGIGISFQLIADLTAGDQLYIKNVGTGNIIITSSVPNGQTYDPPYAATFSIVKIK